MKIPFERLQSLLQQWLIQDDLLSEARGVPIFRKRGERASHLIDVTSVVTVIEAPEKLEFSTTSSTTSELTTVEKVNPDLNFNTIEFGGLPFLVKKPPTESKASECSQV